MTDGAATIECHYFAKARQHPVRWDFGHRMGEALPPDDPFVRLYVEGRSLADGAVVDRDRVDSATKTVFYNQVSSNGQSVFVLAYAGQVGQR